MKRGITALAASVASILLYSGTVLAHESHSHQDSSNFLPMAVFGGSLFVLGAGLYVDQREDTDDRYADIGVFLGVGGFLVAIGLFLF